MVQNASCAASGRNSRATLPPRRRHAILFAVLISLPGAASITFSLLPATARCISETIPVHSLLTGDWKVDAAKDAAQKANAQDKAMPAPGQSPILSRFGGVGSQRYSVGFTGDQTHDWAGLRYLPYFTLT